MTEENEHDEEECSDCALIRLVHAASHLGEMSRDEAIWHIFNLICPFTDDPQAVSAVILGVSEEMIYDTLEFIMLTSDLETTEQ